MGATGELFLDQSPSSIVSEYRQEMKLCYRATFIQVVSEASTSTPTRRTASCPPHRGDEPELSLKQQEERLNAYVASVVENAGRLVCKRSPPMSEVNEVDEVGEVEDMKQTPQTPPAVAENPGSRGHPELPLVSIESFFIALKQP